MRARDTLNTEAASISEEPRLGEKFAWAVLDREKPAANDCCIREKSELKVRLASGKLFPGQYFDQETGLHYNYFRDYDPALGRYIESDPVGLDYDYGKLGPMPTLPTDSLLRQKHERSGINHLYGYAKQNPLKFHDPYGLSPNQTDHLIYPPETNCACTIECKETIIGSGKSLLVGAVCGRYTVPVAGGVVCNSVIVMVCGAKCKDECDNTCD